ncbi:DUF7740 domain-containing protein [Pseudomonas guariconensis]
MRYFDAMVYLALIAEFHGTDAAIVKAAKRYAKAIPRRYRPNMHAIINARSPCMYVYTFVATLPDHIFTMDPKPVPAPHILLAESRQAKAS